MHALSGIVKSYINSYVVRLSHSNFKAQAIKHNREKFITLQQKRRCGNGPDHHSTEVYGEIFMHQLPIKISGENIHDCLRITIYLSMANH